MSVARLQLGQRVYVLRDADGAEVGAWGNVARECFSKQLAWVRLDARHARCPFPADLEHRATWILTLPEQCSSFAPLALAEDRTPEQLAADGDLARAATCRRCVECLGEEHHWLTSMPEFPPDGEPFIPCKHCDARAQVCEECFEGPVWPPATDRRCEVCRAPGGV